MKKYVVMQGMMTATGSGDYDSMGVFSTLEAAKRAASDISQDIRYYANRPPHGYLDTLVIEEGNEDLPLIEHRYYWWKRWE